MNRIKVFALAVALTLVSVPAMADVGNPYMFKLVEGKIVGANLLVLLLNLVTDLFIVLVGLRLLNAVNTVPFRTLMIATSIVFIAGFAADWIGDILSRPFEAWYLSATAKQPTMYVPDMYRTKYPGLVGTQILYHGWAGVLARGLFPVPFIFGANFVIARKLFRMEHSKALLMALMVAAFTAPIYLELITQQQMPLVLREFRHLSPQGSDAHRVLFSISRISIYSTFIPLGIALAAALFGSLSFIMLRIDYGRAWSNARAGRAMAMSCAVMLIVCTAYAAGFESTRRVLNQKNPRINGWTASSLTGVHPVPYTKEETCVANQSLVRAGVFRYKEKKGHYPKDLQALAPEFVQEASDIRCPASKDQFLYKQPPPETIVTPDPTRHLISCVYHSDPPQSYWMCCNNQAAISHALMDYRMKHGEIPTVQVLAKLYPVYNISLYCPSDPRGSNAVSYSTVPFGRRELQSGRRPLVDVKCLYHEYFRNRRAGFSSACHLNRLQLEMAAVEYRRKNGRFPAVLSGLESRLRGQASLHCPSAPNGSTHISYRLKKMPPDTPLQQDVQVVDCPLHHTQLGLMDPEPPRNLSPSGL